MVSSMQGESSIRAVYTPTSALALLAADLKAAGVGIEVSHMDTPSDSSEAILDAIDQVGQFGGRGTQEALDGWQADAWQHAQTVVLKSNCSVLGPGSARCPSSSLT